MTKRKHWGRDDYNRARFEDAHLPEWETLPEAMRAAIEGKASKLVRVIFETRDRGANIDVMAKDRRDGARHEVPDVGPPSDALLGAYLDSLGPNEKMLLSGVTTGRKGFYTVKVIGGGSSALVASRHATALQAAAYALRFGARPCRSAGESPEVGTVL